MGDIARKPCVTRTLAQGDVARIDLCDDCGVLVLHVGPVSIRLEHDALSSLGSTLTQALHHLEGRAELDPDATGVRRKWISRGRA